MSAVEKLQNIQEKNKSYICLGLDLDPKKMPPDLTKTIKGMYEFAMNIIEATKDHVCAYKPNMAFYENLGHDGISLLESIVSRMPKDIPIILDGKRGDIGNTASFYAEAMYEKLRADWVTLSPYMGYDSMRPFLEYDDKGIFVLCLTSNTGSKDFQLLDINGKPLYQVVAEKVDYWNKADNCGLVVGATNPEQLKELREIAKNMPLLIPGVGAQGGSLEKALIYGTDEFKKPAVINVSRSVLYASNGNDYAERARAELIKLNETTKKIKAGEYSEEPSQPEPSEENQQPEQPQQNNSQQDQPKKQFTGYSTQSHHTPEQTKADSEPKTEEPKTDPPSSTTSSAIAATASLSDVPQPEKTEEVPPPSQPVTESQPAQSQPPAQPEQPKQESKPEENRPEPPKEQPAQSSQQDEKPEEPKAPEQQEKKFTPPPLPTPPPPLQPNPEVIKRNREEFERRQKQQQEQRERQNNGQTDNNQNQSNGKNQQNENRHNQNNHRNGGQNNSYKQLNNNRQFNGNRDKQQNNNERRDDSSHQNQNQQSNQNSNQNQNEHQRPNINKPWENK